MEQIIHQAVLGTRWRSVQSTVKLAFFPHLSDLPGRSIFDIYIYICTQQQTSHCTSISSCLLYIGMWDRTRLFLALPWKLHTSFSRHWAKSARAAGWWQLTPPQTDYIWECPVCDYASFRLQRLSDAPPSPFSHVQGFDVSLLGFVKAPVAAQSKVRSPFFAFLPERGWYVSLFEQMRTTQCDTK